MVVPATFFFAKSRDPKMPEVIDKSICTYELLLKLNDGAVIIARSDCPIPALSEEELTDMENKVLALHNTIMKKLAQVITADSYIQLTKDDSLAIVNNDERFALVYPNGTFLRYSPMFYLDWLEENMLLEVVVSEDKLARFVYRK